jgi:hypothetical protein
LKYNDKQFAKAVRAVATVGWSIRKAAKFYQVPKSTLYDSTKGKYKEGKIHNDKRRALDVETENILVDYLIYMSDHGMPLTRKVFALMVRGVVQVRKIMTPFKNDTPSYKWMRHFLKKHREVSIRTPDPLEAARSNVDASDVVHYQDLLQDATSDKSPQQLYNCDETGFSGKDSVHIKVLAKKGKKKIHQHQVRFPGHTTVLSTTCADGTSISPLTIFQGSCPQEVQGVPNNWGFTASKSGWITSDIFTKWFREVFVPETTRKPKPILLIMDNHVSHASVEIVDIAKAAGIDLLYLPPHSSHFLQPLDLGYFNLLKQNMGSLSVSLGYSGVRGVPKDKFPKILQHAMGKINASAIQGSFRNAGIWPFRRVPVPDDHTSSSLTTPEPLITDDLCSECGRCKENPLVKLGVIPKDLADVLIEPPPIKQKRNKGAKKIASRIFKAYELAPASKVSEIELNDNVTDDVSTIPAESEFQLLTNQSPTHLCETQCTPEQGPSKRAKSPVLQLLTNMVLPHNNQVPQNASELCGICLTDTSSDDWAGCDKCPQWYHYGCLPDDQQTLVDFSIVTMEPWFCYHCTQSILEE